MLQCGPMLTIGSQLLFGMPGPFELVVIFVVVLLLFGAAKLPEVGRSLGQGIQEFRKALKGGGNESGEEKDKKE